MAEAFAADWATLFNHYEPSRRLITHPDAVSDKARQPAIDRMKRLFVDLDALL